MNKTELKAAVEALPWYQRMVIDGQIKAWVEEKDFDRYVQYNAGKLEQALDELKYTDWTVAGGPPAEPRPEAPVVGEPA